MKKSVVSYFFKLFTVSEIFNEILFNTMGSSHARHDTDLMVISIAEGNIRFRA